MHRFSKRFLFLFVIVLKCRSCSLSYHLMVAAFRRAPDSFTDQRYHSWMVFEYTAKDEVPRYGKFRLIPADERQETGLMTEDDQRRPW